MNPSKSWAAMPHHVEGVPTIVYIFFILICLLFGYYIFSRMKKDKKNPPLNSKMKVIEQTIKSLKKPPR